MDINNKFYFEKERLIGILERQGIVNKRLLSAMRKIPQKLFAHKSLKELNHNDVTPAIGEMQIIHNLLAVSRMLELLDARKDERILEVGSGEKYNSTLLKILVGEGGKVFSLDVYKSLRDPPKENPKKSNIKDVVAINKKDFFDLEDETPFDKIIVTVSVKKIPGILCEHLSRDDGVIVAIVEKIPGHKIMTKMVKHGENLKIFEFGELNFTPLVEEDRDDRIKETIGGVDLS